jgi:hypothetical protein
VQDRIESVGRVLALLIVLVYLPIRGDYSLLTGVGIVAAALLIGALNLWPKLFHGSEWLIALIAAAVAFVAVPPGLARSLSMRPPLRSSRSFFWRWHWTPEPSRPSATDLNLSAVWQ